MIRRATDANYHAIGGIVVLDRVLSSSPQSARTRIAPQVAKLGDAALVSVHGMIDEHFPGFGDLTDVSTAVLDLQGVTFMTSFGVRQWLKAMGAVPATVTHLYLLNCPTIIVDQLNMILNFGGRAKILSLAAPFACAQCNATSKETIDVIAEGPSIERGDLPRRTCPKCGGELVLDDDSAGYFTCLKKYGASSVEPAAEQLVANRAALKNVVVKPSIRAATAPSLVAAPVAASSPSPSRARTLLPVIALVTVLLAIAIGVYVLVGPS